jgi:hypothetical protein
MLKLNLNLNIITFTFKVNNINPIHNNLHFNFLIDIIDDDLLWSGFFDFDFD